MSADFRTEEGFRQTPAERSETTTADVGSQETQAETEITTPLLDVGSEITWDSRVVDASMQQPAKESTLGNFILIIYYIFHLACKLLAFFHLGTNCNL